MNLSNSKEGSSSCRCITTSIGENEETEKIVWRILFMLQIMLEDSFISRAWIGEEMVRNSCSVNLMENGTKLFEDMMLNFAESGHPIFRATTAFERGELKCQGQVVKSIHFNGSDETIESIFRTVIFVNQLSINGAVADLCGELRRDSVGTGKRVADENLESSVIPTKFLTANPISRTDVVVQGNLLHEYEQKFAELPEQQKLTKLCSNAGFFEDC